ncbi:SDR family NAD(P)-dependent oxidoreductase [Flammeovirga yaeyamensis]|uniref:SDR family NAD(P)-dependent oxidoreductase n=1 Tax=Flammeovirga yaeyamensis TaxID=367791 RepID=A0AAX1N9C2_9BACT|nr:SDR family NAD(P)-dependent oxidoreductase [Flammeovirga yaeyamensis]MBB3699562.1 short-subunit dehydrogenase [Flammeovirga yaeyamensis]NMF35183.1 SDR family NAD(P)-dependent oxidoreductase [Flammeovirga yaeyamensis]QWG04047.1 SDR family NAD(P)-dependent oxidoreductase [Flammeovirga yaeyamensis]
MKYYKNKNIYITGGTSGIGLEMSKQLLKSGANVVVFGRKNLSEIESKLSESTNENSVAAISLDTTSVDSVIEGFSKAQSIVGDPHVVIHSAGIGRSVAFNQFSEDDFKETINVNIFGSRNVAEVAFPYLKKTNGQLLFIASLAGIVTNYGYSAYSASKFATLGFAGVLRSEWKPEGVNVSVACPPEIDTPLVEKERLESPKVAKVLKQFAGNLELDYACKMMLKGLSKKSYMIIPGFKAKLVAITQGIFPSMNIWISDLVIRVIMKKNK